MYKNKQAYRLQMLRKRKGLTTRKLGEKLGVSNGIISRWCTGSAYPSRKHVIKICEFFKVEAAWFKDRVLEIAKALLNSQVNKNNKKDYTLAANQ